MDRIVPIHAAHWKGWQVAETITALAGQCLIDPPIVVGITSTANRLAITRRSQRLQRKRFSC